GQIIGLYMVLYSTARFLIEFFRVHEQALVGPFSLTQWIALGVFAAGAVILTLCRPRERARGQFEPAPLPRPR
ncbi:MAG TPA: prolipoprotein diacylglyceryl transferase family protein, partial [Bryobacteraceae bacterium]